MTTNIEKLIEVRRALRLAEILAMSHHKETQDACLNAIALVDEMIGGAK